VQVVCGTVNEFQSQLGNGGFDLTGLKVTAIQLQQNTHIAM
jgi:hypothetical protein